MQKIFLIGYMGAGKSTIGKCLSKQMELQFIDLDHFIENRHRKKISELFGEKGEDGFRVLERNALLEVSEFENVIISTGGGTPCFFDNMEIMNQLGQTIYLKASVEELADRLNVRKDDRPLIQGKELEEIKRFVAHNLVKREYWYNQARYIFDTEEINASYGVDQAVNYLVSQLVQIL
ncbi:MAG: shikimate kinase [Candidatus Azobacteroides sp.]|nr:shikimate kinase [Candidatus Azobacteroides sp.]